MSELTEHHRQPERLSLSMTQIVASVLAAVSASVVASVFGVAGTLIGAALGSVVSVIGSSLYAHSLVRTRNRMRVTVDAAVSKRFGVSDPPADPQALSKPATAVAHPAAAATAVAYPAAAAPARARWWSLVSPKQFAVSAAALFVIAIGIVTGAELLSGHPIASTVTGGHSSGTTVFGTAPRRSASPINPLPPTSTPTSSTQSTPAPTVTVTQPQTATGSPIPTPTATDTTSPTATAPTTVASPTATPSGSGLTGTG